MRAWSSILVAGALLLPAALGAQSPVAGAAAASARDLDRLTRGELLTGLPPADSVTAGARVVAAGTSVRGSVVARGPVDVYGTVDGNAVSLAGDVTVHRGGVVEGDALSVGGRVVADSGRVGGELRTVSSLAALLPTAAVGAPPTAAQATIGAVRLVAGSFAMLLLVAIGVLLFAAPNLDEVVGTLERSFGRAFWVGLGGQLLVLPALVLLIVALALTVIGVLLIPFAIVAYAIAVAGLVTLGFLAVARLVGGAFWQAEGASPRARTLGALVVGVGSFFMLWLVAAAFGWAPLAASVLRAAALAATWAAMTLGLGAALVSRAGTHRRVASGQRPVELASWQTPTPITGVIAARRPVAAGEGR